MVHLYTLKELSAFSSDSIYKICLAVDRYGLSEDNIKEFEDYDAIFDAAITGLEKGKHIIIAVEPNDYIKAKKELVAKLILDTAFSNEIAEIITINAGDDLSEFDMEGSCLVPEGSLVHITNDGLYSGFTCKALSGKLSYIPLDFMRLDDVLSSMIKYEEQELVEAQKQADIAALMEKEIEMPEYDFSPAVTKMVRTLESLDKKVALTTSEATMWIYNLYDSIEGLTDTINFVEIADAEKGDDSDESSQEAAFEEGLEEAMAEKEERDEESESMRIIRHAREAMYNTDCSFGGAISKVYTTENERGQTIYYAYVAVVDRSTAKAKKINTANPDDIPLILPHAVTILTDVVCQKAETVQTAIAKIDYSDSQEEKEPEEKKEEKAAGITLTKGMLAFAAAVLVFALVSPMLMTYLLLKPETTAAPSAAPSFSDTAVYQPVSDTTAPTTVPTTQSPFITSPSATAPSVTESTAPDVSATTTTAAVASEKGVFNFYVFGYGHGVGMSQVGANHLANTGWSSQEILAHYYYDANTRIVTGDTYPETVKYAGTDYKIRDYLASALESEMGSSFHPEALKAQAIAIYTFAKYNGYNLSTDAHAFGKTPSDIVYTVVDDVISQGFYIASGSDVAVTPFHAMSAGVTTSYYNVWGKSIGTTVSYLSGGRTSPGDYLDTNYKSTFTITSDDLKKLVKENAGITLTGDPSGWLSIITHDSAVREDIGYISSINVGGTIMTGNDFRIKVMGGRIRSHCFAMTYTPGV